MKKTQQHKQEVKGIISYTYTCKWVGCEESLKYDYDSVTDSPDRLPGRWEYVSVSRGGRINDDTGLPPASDVYGVLCPQHVRQLRNLLKKMNKKNKQDEITIPDMENENE